MARMLQAGMVTTAAREYADGRAGRHAAGWEVRGRLGGGAAHALMHAALKPAHNHALAQRTLYLRSPGASCPLQPAPRQV